VPRNPPRLAIVVPCYNEEAALPTTAGRLGALLTDLFCDGAIAPESAVVFVDDGSTDRTWHVIEGLAAADPRCHAIKLSRNHGHQHALLSGVLTARGDAVITIDADLQDDIGAVREMVDAYAAGAEIVYGVRRERRSDAWFKRVTAEGYYWFAHLMGVRLVFNHADYRLLSRRAIDALTSYGESNLFLRGLIPQLGFNSSIVYYDRQERIAGKSKYSVAKMVGLALDGITSFSAAPLRLITALGFLVAFISFATAVWALWVAWFNPDAVPGWASTLIPLLFLGGIQVFCTGIIGQYLAKVYLETKARPRFIIEKQI
jgi:polyisoprenyl-phosphate glycosyltransferase